LPRPLGWRFWKLAVFLAPYGLGASQFGFAQLGARLFDQGLAKRVALELTDDAVRAEPRCAAVDQALGETRIGQPAFAFERIEQSFQGIGLFDERYQFAREFCAAVFATGQIAERAAFQGTARALGFVGAILIWLDLAWRAARAGVGGFCG
jgi:hypothetical protein